jgi:hypothetical protein
VSSSRLTDGVSMTASPHGHSESGPSLKLAVERGEASGAIAGVARRHEDDHSLACSGQYQYDFADNLVLDSNPTPPAARKSGGSTQNAKRKFIVRSRKSSSRPALGTHGCTSGNSSTGYPTAEKPVNRVHVNPDIDGLRAPSKPPGHSVQSLWSADPASPGWSRSTMGYRFATFQAARLPCLSQSAGLDEAGDISPERIALTPASYQTTLEMSSATASRVKALPAAYS